MTASTASVISLQHIQMTFHDQNGELEVLRDIQVEIRPQEFLCVLGPSGCGKSTLLRMLAGLLAPTGGQLLKADNQQLSVGLVFQQSNLMPWRTVLDNILLPMELRVVPQDAALQKRRT
jgi:NitT/TauT family transport system ATP-binding protein